MEAESSRNDMHYATQKNADESPLVGSMTLQVGGQYRRGK